MIIIIIISIMLMRRVFYFATEILKNNKNSINPIGQHYAYGYYFPKQWSEEDIYSQIDPNKKSISDIQLVKNRIGQRTGKVLFKFFTEASKLGCIDKYNQDFIITKNSTHRVIIKPFELKTRQLRTQQALKRTKNQVRIKNLDFDITKQELSRLARDYGSVENIEMHIRPNGLNDGMATIHFKKHKEAQDFSYFCQGLVFRERKLSAQVINLRSKQPEEAYIEQPKITMAANLKLYKRLVASQFEKQTNKKQS